jgi:hypothetical protein
VATFPRPFTPPVVRGSCVRALLAVALVCMPLIASAQTIVGRVLLPDSATPATGIVITATTPTGTVVGRVLSTQNGSYSITLKSAGTYEVRALRIGFRPTTARVTVPAGATVKQDIVVTAIPVAIEGIRVTNDADCTLKGKNAQAFLTLLDQSRAALGAASLWEQSGALRVEVVRVEGRVDATYGNKYDSLYAQVDTAKGRHFAATRTFGATPPETLNTSGYLRLTAEGQYLYDMPNAEVLLSDEFVSTHCFSIHANEDQPGWIGLGFKPRKRVKNFVDVRGTLWLDRSSSELRRLEFEYDNTPEGPYDTCDKAPFIKITPDLMQQVPPFQQPEPSCPHFTKNNNDNRLGLGGSADFVRLVSGEWLISKSTMVTGPDEGRYRRMWRKSRWNPMTKRTEHCVTGPSCREILTFKPRLVTIASTTARVLRDGVEVYRDSTAQALIDAINRRRK